MTKIIEIAGAQWGLKFLTEELAARIATGDENVVHAVFHYSWPHALFEKSKYQHSPLALIIYEAHAVAAAYGQYEIARSFYERGKLGETAWEGCDLHYPSRICPVCFRLIGEVGLNARHDCGNGHLVFRYSAELQTYELKSGSEIDASIFQNVTSESANFDEVSEALFTEDIVGRALQSACDGKVWFKALPGGDNLEDFCEFWDLEHWSDTICYGYHPEGVDFIERIMEYYQQMIERCKECGLDACDVHFG